MASVVLAKRLDLSAIAKALDDVEYDPEKFPGLIFRLKDPKTATLLFSSGKAVCTGGKSLEQVRTAIATVAKRIEKAGVTIVKHPEIIIQNMVAVHNIGSELDLNSIAVSLGLERIEYEPEQFPGLVYRLTDPKVVVLLFGSGKIVLTGAKRTEDIEIAVKKLRDELSATGLLH